MVNFIFFVTKVRKMVQKKVQYAVHICLIPLVCFQINSYLCNAVKEMIARVNSSTRRVEEKT